MPELTPPSVLLHRSFLDAMAEFAAEGRGGASDDSMVGAEIRGFGAGWHDPAVFARYLATLEAAARPETPRPDGRVACTTYWYADGPTYLGRLAIRHTLNGPLLEWGGHIGYDVRPSARRRGHATAMLREALPLARALGIDPALLTCDVENTPSRKVIEACGGVYEDTRVGKRRYWVPTSG
ncbi:GNAT family N-acetyltransferase [Actinacidiphila guanduensis]|uniref:Predicted acetyltransferase n=1 Tax=Actinacidiphila guanduensis TaxID=310781 RepID=A0A1H0HRP5_9ACTN|nr:GNAT family N-acetyltransferase [Actinacidiphila guanduensis]SDO21750.1 Predicted acetyltransferase [Actinacidiphila guanduensis]